MVTQPASTKPDPNSGGRWAILGGAFDPVHWGHIRLASNIKPMADLDGVLLVPSFHPPHKQNGCVANFADRMRMLELALPFCDSCSISDIESTLTEPTYTLYVIHSLRKKFPLASLELLIGADQWKAFETWHKPQEILDTVPVIVGERPGFVRATQESLETPRVRFIHSGLVDLSSSRVRSALDAGIDRAHLGELVPEAVADYIIGKGLYR